MEIPEGPTGLGEDEDFLGGLLEAVGAATEEGLELVVERVFEPLVESPSDLVEGLKERVREGVKVSGESVTLRA